MSSRVSPAETTRSHMSARSLGRPGIVLGCLTVALLSGLSAHVGSAFQKIGGGAPSSADNLVDAMIALFPYGAIALSFLALAGIAVSPLREKRRARLLSDGGRMDTFTGLPNKLALLDALTRALDPTQSSRVALIVIDLDGFEALVDRHGRAAADLILAEVAQRLKFTVRADDHLSRIADDAFAIVQESPTGADAAGAMAERLLNIIAAPFDVGGLYVLLGANIGISLKETGVTPQALLERADLALRGAKTKGRGAYCFFGSEIDHAARREATMAERLRLGLEKDQFEVHYQPIIQLRDERIIGYEALLRWKDGGHGYVPPLDFIPVAEKTGLIAPIGAWVLEQACNTAATLPAETRVAVNVSAIQLRDERFIEALGRLLKRSGLRPERLQLEVTEIVLIERVEEILKSLRELSALGVKLALDDFGTGYSSLCFLDDHSVDHLKIDRALISTMEAKDSTLSIVQAIVSLAHRLGMKVVAEGVETQSQLELLRAMECDEAQGYLIGRPAPRAATPAGEQPVSAEAE